ncbi:hypothetical protein [Mycoplasma struthionis]|uniref:Uncharacterized protein n=1 Tax=Mycoplasma struthionis TaxID=538220 RepID=A0A502M1Z2_9MOLU|nr:hypothetical protein [Mycoplasma struthionis]TPI01166.1 hypothetical protein FJM01_03050 [Mycoplasma struthionis]
MQENNENKLQKLNDLNQKVIKKDILYYLILASLGLFFSIITLALSIVFKLDKVRIEILYPFILFLVLVAAVAFVSIYKTFMLFYYRKYLNKVFIKIVYILIAFLVFIVLAYLINTFLFANLNRYRLDTFLKNEVVKDITVIKKIFFAVSIVAFISFISLFTIAIYLLKKN